MRIAFLALALAVASTTACQSSDVSRELGARCDHAADCDERCLAPSLDWPGGFCTISCDTDGDCPGGAACVDEDGGAICAYVCGTDPQCAFLGNGYVCRERDHHGLAEKANVCRG